MCNIMAEGFRFIYPAFGLGASGGVMVSKLD